MATITVVAASRGGQQQPLPHPYSLSPQQLREWVIQQGRPGGGGYLAGGAGQQRQPTHPDTLSPQQIHEWIVQRGRPGGGGYGFIGTGQRRQQCQQETFSPQRLRDCVSQRGVPGCVEAASLGASESAAALGASASIATGPASAEALHTFTLDSRAPRCFFHDCTTVTSLTASVPVSLADPTGGPVVARASTVFPCPAVPSGSLSGLHLPTFSTNLVSNTILQNVWVDTLIPGGKRVAICGCVDSGVCVESGVCVWSLCCVVLVSGTLPPDSSLAPPTRSPLSAASPQHALPSRSIEPSGPYLELVGCLITLGMGLVLGGQASVVLTGHSDASWVDDQATQRSSQGYTFSIGSGSVSWRSTHSFSVLSSSCEAEIYAGAMAAQELRC
ncbi:unnamed protein product [Closterium sp. NIES-53]